MTSAEETGRAGASASKERKATDQQPIHETTVGDKATTTTSIKTSPASNTTRNLTRSTAIHASRNTVLETTELRGRIISFLTRSDILINAQRVNSLWKETIETSPKIRTIPWRGPLVLSPHGNTYDPASTEAQNHRNSVFLGLSGFYTETKLAMGVPIYSERIAFNEHWFSDHPLCDFLGFISRVAPLNLRSQSFPWFLPKGFKQGNMQWGYRQIYGAQGVQPSWLDMFITSPPIMTAQVSVLVWYSKRAHKGRWVCATVYDRSGITYAIAAYVVKKIKAHIHSMAFIGTPLLPPMICFVEGQKVLKTNVPKE